MRTNRFGIGWLPAAALGLALCLLANVVWADVAPPSSRRPSDNRVERRQGQEDQFRYRTLAAGIALSTVTACGFLLVVLVRRRRRNGVTEAAENGSAAKPSDSSLAEREDFVKPPTTEDSGLDDGSNR